MQKFKISDILIGIIFTLLFISIGVIAAVNFRFIYYLDVNYLNIPARSGLTTQVILDNYNALIDYNSPFFKGDLQFPSLPASSSGLQHFVEVKNIFTSFYFIGLIALILTFIIVLYKARKKEIHYLFVSAITVVVMPTIVVLFCAINFDAAFVFFHKIFFRNDYWLFNPDTDPVINILPDTFFLHSLLVIIAFVLAGSLILYTVYRIFKKREVLNISIK